jgi:hypothetical protein
VKRVSEGALIPDGYGVAWCDPTAAIAICVPMPFHRLFGWAYRTYWHWRTWKGADDVLWRAYNAGYDAARRQADQQRAYLVAQHDLERDRAFERGRQHAERAIYEAIMNELRGETRH